MLAIASRNNRLPAEGKPMADNIIFIILGVAMVAAAILAVIHDDAR